MGKALTLIALTSFCLSLFFVTNQTEAAKIQFPNEEIQCDADAETCDSRKESDDSTSDLDENQELESSDTEKDQRRSATDSNLANPEVYPTEQKYCDINMADNSRGGYKLKIGTNNADELYGTTNKDLIFGLDGNDKIYGLKGGDIICGGKGNDVSYGDPYSDYPIAKLPNGDIPLSSDFIFGQEGKDTIYGGAGSDFIHGGMDEDSLYGHDGVWVGGGLYNDGNDIIDGGPDYDSCHDHESKTYVNCEYTDDAIVK